MFALQLHEMDEMSGRSVQVRDEQFIQRTRRTVGPVPLQS